MKFTLKTENKVKNFTCTERVNGGVKFVSFTIDFNDLITPKPTVISWKVPVTDFSFTLDLSKLPSVISETPLISEYSLQADNLVTYSPSDSVATCRFEKRVIQNDNTNEYLITLFENLKTPVSTYSFTLRIDERKIKYYDAVTDAAKWWKAQNGLTDDVNSDCEPTYSLKCACCKNIVDNASGDLVAAESLGLKSVYVEDAKLSGEEAKESVESLQTFFGECQRAGVNVTFNGENNLFASDCKYSAETKLAYDILSKLLLNPTSFYVNPPTLYPEIKKDEAFYLLSFGLFGAMQISAYLSKVAKEVSDVIRYVLYYQNENKELLQRGNSELPIFHPTFGFVKKTLGDKTVTALYSDDSVILKNAFEDIVSVNGKNYFYADLTSTDLNYTYTVFDSDGTLISAGEVIGGSIYKIEAKSCSIIQFVQK